MTSIEKELILMIQGLAKCGTMSFLPTTMP